MDVQLQQIFEPVFVGVIAGAIILLIIILFSKSYTPRFAYPIVNFFFKNAHLHIDREHGPTTLETAFIAMLLIAIAYSLGVGIERVADEIKDGPPQQLFFMPGLTDREIKLEVFREAFEDEWPEHDTSCRFYTDDEIVLTYYNANNYLKRLEPPAGELKKLLRRIHFSESMSVVLLIGACLLFLTLLVIAILLINCKIFKVHAANRTEKNFVASCKLVINRLSHIRFARLFVVSLVLGSLSQVADKAWYLDERHYDQLVFGYYLVELQNSMASQKDALPRAHVGMWSRIPNNGGILRGTGETRFDASGVVWFDHPQYKDPVMIVVNDKTPFLTVHDINGRLIQTLELPPEWQNIVDFEEISPGPGDTFYLLASHSTFNRKQAPNRQHLLNVKIAYTSQSSHPTTQDKKLTIVDVKSIDLKPYLKNTCIDKENTKCLLSGWEDDENSKCCEVNIEGMVLADDKHSLLLGFREPILCDSNNNPVSPIYRLELNDQSSLKKLAPAGSVPVNLTDKGFPGPHGISAMAYDPQRKQYLILTSYESDQNQAGSNVPSQCRWKSEKNNQVGQEIQLGGALWHWSGEKDSKPKLVAITKQHKPEGIAVYTGQKTIDGNKEKRNEVIVFDNDDDQELVNAREPIAYYSRSGLSKRCAPLMPFHRTNVK